MSKRIRTNYLGVYYRETKRLGKNGNEKVFYIVFKKNDKVHEEKVGRQFVDDMSAAKAARIRGMRIENKIPSRKEMRQAEKNKWTIRRLWDEYKVRNPSLRGLITDEGRFKNYIEPTFGDKEPKEISADSVDRLRIDLLKYKAPQTVKHVLALLTRICNFGVKKNLCAGLRIVVQLPPLNNEKTEDLTPTQLSRLIEAINQDSNIQAASLMRMALFTGMRRGSLFRLKWADVDFDRGFITLRSPKSGKDEKVPLNDQARLVLEAHPRTDSPYVFPGRGGRQRTDIRKQVNRIKERAGLPKDFRALHGLRHVYASMLASSGKVDLYTLQKLLTHRSPRMTQRYAHLRDEALKNAASLAGSLIEEHSMKGNQT